MLNDKAGMLKMKSPNTQASLVKMNTETVPYHVLEKKYP